MTRADIVRNIINDDGYYYTKHSVLEIVNVIFDEHEAQLKAKENHIVELNKMVMEKNEITDVLHISSSGFNDLYDDYRKLSRSIVAMLFWEWKSGIKYIESQYDKGIVEGMRYSFHKAYKMIKDTQ